MINPVRNFQVPLLSLVLISAITLFGGTAEASVLYSYLTWQGDTSTTMTVTFHTDKKAPKPMVYYDTVSRDGNPKAYAHSEEARTHQISEVDNSHRVHHSELTELTADTTYYFIAGSKRGGFSAEKKFRTLPDDDSPIRFVTGGDMDSTPLTRNLLTIAAAEEPRFVAIGGDVAYANGNYRGWGKWERWLQNWETLMVTPEGYTVPMIMAIGNHETQGMFDKTPDDAPFYFGYFPQEEKSYFTRTIGTNFVFFVLDTSHVTPHGGEQAAWMDQEFGKYADTPYRFALYHVPLYTTFRKYDDKYAKRGRETWLPIFDKHRITTCFENHDHELKRTKLLKGNKVDPEGTLYLGDGCFGVVPRQMPEDSPRWYHEVAQSIGHVWVVDVATDGVTYRALDQRGKLLDETTTPGR